MKYDRYSVKEFNEQFPTDSACLDFIFAQRHPDGGFCSECGRSGCFYRVKRRKCYSCAHCGHQISPTEGTIFHKSRTSLRSWFFAMFLMAIQNFLCVRFGEEDEQKMKLIWQELMAQKRKNHAKLLLTASGHFKTGQSWSLQNQPP